jgi:hypothetical protein
MISLSKVASSLRSTGLVALALVATAAFASPALAPAGEQDFILHNSIGSTIREVYVSPTSTTDWEEDVLGSDVLPQGESVEITFDDEEYEEMWDLKVVTTTGAEIVWTELDLTTISEVTLFIRNGRPVATTK